MKKKISTIRKVFALITLRYFNVSTHRKRVFRSTFLLLLALIFIQIFKALILPPIAYLSELIAVAILTVIVNIFFNVIRLFIVSNHRNRRGISKEESDNFTIGVNALVNSATVIVAIVIFFWFFGIEVKSFLSSIALFAVAIVLIFQDFIKNFLFGFSMMFSNDYEIGDYVQVGETPKGVITSLTFSNLQIKTEAGALLYIPNAVVRNHQVVNFSKLRPKHMVIEFLLPREKFTIVEELQTSLIETLDTKFPELFDSATAKVHVHSSTKEDITFVFEVTSKSASLKLKEELKHAVQAFAVEY